MTGMSQDSTAPHLNEVPPVETAGRETIARFNAQFRAAAYQCLSILTGKDIDRVYCDYQDDFVARRTVDGRPVYHFYQVKTKGQRNYRWSKTELFGLYAKKASKPERLADSFIGKLMLHTIRFNTSCGSVVFLTNVHFDNNVEALVQAISSSDFTNADLKAFADSFNSAFNLTPPLNASEVEARLRKLVLTPGITYLDPHDRDFGALARAAIYKYSEIDLQHAECEEIIRSLLDIVQQKSFQKLIGDLDEASLDEAAGVGITDLLEILSISKGAYDELVAGGDPKAVKNASIIQRKLSQAGVNADMIEYCSRCKVQWDMWLREKRHSIPEFELNFLLEDLNAIKNQWVIAAIKFAGVRVEIDQLWDRASSKGLTSTMTKDILLGGLFAALVRSEAQ